MFLNKQPYLIAEPLPEGDILREWRWKLGATHTPLALTRAGDAFITDPGGSILWLDTGAGTLATVAASLEALDLLLSDPSEADRLLLTTVIDQDVKANGPFRAGACLGFTMLPVLGGSYTIENRFRLSAVEHFGVTGDMHRQMRDLPDGTKVRIKIVP